MTETDFGNLKMQSNFEMQSKSNLPLPNSLNISSGESTACFVSDKYSKLIQVSTRQINSLPHPIAYVPTMGALHRGHQKLISEAKKLCDTVLVSIFVNPLQFGSKTDFENYPRDDAADFELAQQAGATHIWFPTYDELFPQQPQVISAGKIGDEYEGKSRPRTF